MANSLVDQIDLGLARLYKLKGQEYDNIFKTQCEDNGFDDDESITEEMGTTVQESQLVDDEFTADWCPWIQSKGEQRRDEIFKILLECYKNPNAYSNAATLTPLTVTQTDFSVTKQDIERAKQFVEEQAPSIYDGGFSNDGSLCYMLAVTMKKKNYLQYLVDMFLREKLYHHYRTRNSKQGYTPYDCAQFQEKNLHIAKTLRNIPNVKNMCGVDGQNNSVLEVSVAAVKSYNHRVAPKLLFTQLDRIIYPYRTVAQYVVQTIEFVNQMAAKQQDTCPFQYDSVFAFQETTADETDGINSDDNDDDEEDGGDNGDGVDAVRTSQLGDIKECLTTTELQFKSGHWDQPDERMYRPLQESFRALKTESLKDQSFPRFGRFCSVLDLRNDPKTEDKAEHNLFVFQPEENSRTIHKNASSLNYFHNIRRSIIPCTEQKADDEKEQNTPTLASGTQGPQIMLSFQVEQEDEMRCYLFISGQCTRFLPEDLKMLLPLFFDLQEGDRKFIDSKEMDEMIQNLSGKLRDDKFRAFLSDNAVQCPYTKELREQSNMVQ